jgi:crotonobetainyl-CoA:carnitine CoA-transferase CaiB-like acyl-CoA transferase
VLTPAEVIAEPHLKERGFFPSVPHPAVGEVRITASPYHLDGRPVLPRGPAAYHVGEHTRAVLSALLGYDDARIAALAAAGAIEIPGARSEAGPRPTPADPQ